MILPEGLVPTLLVNQNSILEEPIPRKLSSLHRKLLPTFESSQNIKEEVDDKCYLFNFDQLNWINRPFN
jgi:hypothetical protein